LLESDRIHDPCWNLKLLSRFVDGSDGSDGEGIDLRFVNGAENWLLRDSTPSPASG